jgi:hypothetical protein
MLMGGLRMLLCSFGMLHALRMIAFAMMLGRRTVSFGCILMVLGCLVVFVSSHLVLRGVLFSASDETS